MLLSSLWSASGVRVAQRSHSGVCNPVSSSSTTTSSSSSSRAGSLVLCQAKRGRPKRTEAAGAAPEPESDDAPPAPPTRGRLRRRTQQVVSLEGDVQGSIAMTSSEEQAVGRPRSLDPDQEQEDTESLQPPPGLHRGRAVQVRSYEAALSADEEDHGRGELDWDLVAEADALDDVRVPADMQPKTRAEAEYLLKHMVWERHLQRRWEAEALENVAWEIFHYQRERTYNEFANAKALTAVMARIELEDHKTGRVEGMQVPSWVRAQFEWGPHFDAYNEYVRVNAENMVNKLPPGADDYDVEVMDDVLLLTEDVMPEDSSSQQGVDTNLLPAGLDSFLTGVLPGTGPGNELGQGYLEDMLRDNLEEKEMLEEESALG